MALKKISFAVFAASILTSSITQATNLAEKDNQIESMRQENILRSEQSGVSITQLEKSDVFQDKFYEFITHLESNNPDLISSAWVEPAPETKGYIRFVDDAPQDRKYPSVK